MGGSKHAMEHVYVLYKPISTSVRCHLEGKSGIKEEEEGGGGAEASVLAVMLVSRMVVGGALCLNTQ